jgi:hypothetical protein
MRSGISSPKDLWAGLLYIAFGAAALLIGADYKVGTAGRMGPGYFPKALAWLLIGIGVVAMARAFLVKGGPITGIAWKQMGFVLAGTALFGWLLTRAGLIVALLALVLVSAAASREFRFDWRATGGLVLLIAFCALVFVKGLGVPMPLLGTWLEPWLGAALPWLK